LPFFPRTQRPRRRGLFISKIRASSSSGRTRCPTPAEAGGW
jgi:hypothetical protein